MSQDRITFRTDSLDKSQFEQLVSTLGLTTSSALNLFIKAAVREQRLPIDLALDPLIDNTSVAARAEIKRILEERTRIANDPSTQWLTSEQVRKSLGI